MRDSFKREKKETTEGKKKENSLENKETLWVVTELYYPEMTSTGYYLTKIAEGLTDRFQVKVLCGQPNYSARGTRAPRSEKYNNVQINRAFGTTLDKNIIPFRLINMITLSASMFFKAIFKFKKNGRVLVVTTPPTLPFITALAARIRGSRYTLLIHDNYPEILIAAGKSKPDSISVKFLNFVNKWVFNRAERIIVVGRDMKKLVEAKIKKNNQKRNIPIDIIQNWAELEQVEPKDRYENKLLKELGLTAKFVFLYAGNMGYPNDLESLIFCAEKLKGEEHFHFLFLGAGVKRKWLESAVSEKKLTNVTVLEPRPRSEQNIFLNACDIGVVSLVKKMWGVSMPSRTYNILASGKPILALTEENSELAQVVEEEKVGWVVSPNEPENLLREIRKIYQERDKLPEMNRKARQAAIKKYSLETALQKYKTSLMANASDNA